MKKSTLTALLSTSLAATTLADVQPWSGYHVHEKSRPTPQKVEGIPQLGTPAPAGADILFAGKNTDALTKKWPIKDGALVASALGDNRTKKDFGSCHIHLEWKIPADRKVKGQQGGNSGIFIMDRYEVQIQESHTNVTYADGQAGALYGQYPPLVNASTAKGQWQSYDIIFTAPTYKDDKLESPAYITVIHNGVIIHNHQKLHGPTVHKTVAKYPAKHPAKAPIRLQFHGDPVEYKNFWVKDLTPRSGAQKSKPVSE